MPPHMPHIPVPNGHPRGPPGHRAAWRARHALTCLPWGAGRARTYPRTCPRICPRTCRTCLFRTGVVGVCLSACPPRLACTSAHAPAHAPAHAAHACASALPSGSAWPLRSLARPTRPHMPALGCRTRPHLPPHMPRMSVPKGRPWGLPDLCLPWLARTCPRTCRTCPLRAHCHQGPPGHRAPWRARHALTCFPWGAGRARTYIPPHMPQHMPHMPVPNGRRRGLPVLCPLLLARTCPHMPPHMLHMPITSALPSRSTRPPPSVVRIVPFCYGCCFGFDFAGGITPSVCGRPVCERVEIDFSPPVKLWT